MPDISIRPYQRRDRDQVTSLVNRHLAAILPGLSVSANALLAQFEREPEEYVVDPWVVDRRVLVRRVTAQRVRRGPAGPLRQRRDSRRRPPWRRGDPGPARRGRVR